MLGKGMVPTRQHKIVFAFIVSAAFLFLNIAWPTQLGLMTICGTALVVLPVGLVSVPFSRLVYTLDAALGRVKPVQRFWDFALFVAFLPPMVAGPIERAPSAAATS